ncbi:glycosyltransferase [Microbacterium sp. NPDC019599]|uniref:glycosyltransferase n=1 Tax=Microbacterium sp. NPDC019599 TaxID=3154690 RepID=UPI0033FBA78D
MSTVVAVIPVFRAPADLLPRVVALAEQVSAVILVDDGTDSLDAGVQHPGVTYIPLPENRGIASALNVGIERARALGATHILTLDQDSTAPAGFVRRMLDAIARAEAEGVVVAAAVPGMVGDQPALRLQDPRFAFDPIQAGQLVPVAAFDDVGAFAEDLFIDAVDSDFTVRAEEQGRRFVVADGERIDHGLGELVPVTLFGRHLAIGGKPRHVLYHAPFRTYYMVRNSVVLSRTHGRARRAWMRRRNRMMIEMVVGCIALSPDRGAQLRATWLGLRDGRRGRLGKIADDTLARVRGRGARA